MAKNKLATSIYYERGFALALTLFLLLILSTVCFGALSIATIDSRTTFEDYKASRAHYAARAGIAAAKSGVAKARSNISLSDNFSAQANLTPDGVESYSITVKPAPNNDDRDFQIWKVVSTGRYQDATRVLEGYLEIESFSKYAYFTNQDVSSSGTVINFANQDCLTGHTHTNGYFTISGQPQFSNRVTSANYYGYNSRNNDPWFNVSDYSYRMNGSSASRTYDPSKFYHPSNGSYQTDKPRALDESPNFSFAGGQTAIPLPIDAGDAKTAAKAEGTYYDKNYYKVIFDENGTAKIYEAYSDYNGRIYYPSTPTYTQSSKKDPGLTLYFKGQVEVQGTVQGRVTLASGSKINITGDLVYKDSTQDVLGLISSGDIMVATSQSSASRDRYIHAVMMALQGSFYVQNYNNSYIGRGGKLHIYGGVVQSARGAVGTGTVQSISTGYAKDYVYDQKLRTRPPLNFPTTGRLKLKYFIDKGSLGGI